MVEFSSEDYEYLRISRRLKDIACLSLKITVYSKIVIEIRKKDDLYLIQCLPLHFDIYKRIQAKSFDFHELFKLFFLKSLSINLKKTISKDNHIDICPLWQIIQLLIHHRRCTSENEHLEVILVKKSLVNVSLRKMNSVAELSL